MAGGLEGCVQGFEVERGLTNSVASVRASDCPVMLAPSRALTFWHHHLALVQRCEKHRQRTLSGCRSALSLPWPLSSLSCSLSFSRCSPPRSAALLWGEAKSPL
eukprot:3870617-Rhodomonas_salina.1